MADILVEATDPNAPEPVKSGPVSDETIQAREFLKSRLDGPKDAEGVTPTVAPVTPPVTPKTAEEPEEEDTEEPEEKPVTRYPRSARREINKFRENAAEERGRRLALEDIVRSGIVPKAADKPAPKDEEPQREAFANDSEYNKAVAQFEGRKGALEVSAQAEDKRKLAEHYAAMNDKFQADAAHFADWGEAVTAGQDGPEIRSDTHAAFLGALDASPEKARISYHLAKHPDQLGNLLEIVETGNLDYFLRQFNRLEGRVEMLYPFDKAAQASDTGKTATHPADAPPAGRRSASERDAGKPKPTSEVSIGSGGVAPRDRPDPVADPAAWIMDRQSRGIR